MFQHKVAYGSSMPPSPGSYNSHGGGSMGPPQSHQLGMPPPPPPHHDGPMPPPPPASTPTHDVHDSTITTTAPTQGNFINITADNHINFFSYYFRQIRYFKSSSTSKYKTFHSFSWNNNWLFQEIFQLHGIKLKALESRRRIENTDRSLLIKIFY